MPHTAIEVKNLFKSFAIKQEHNAGNDSIRGMLSAKNVKRILSSTLAKRHNKTNDEIFWALSDINFKIEKGSRLGIIGPNGAGKSTLLKILSRITEPTTGDVSINGRVVSLLEVGTGFHPELTGRENVFLNGIILGMKRAEVKKKFEEIVAFSGIEKFLDTPVKKYSSGMYMRLAFAVAVHMEPDILIIDEMLSVGDAQFQKKCIKKIEEIGENKDRTIIFVSHNIDAVRLLCNKALFLNKGHLIKSGDLSEVMDAYITAYTPKSIFQPNTNKETYINAIKLMIAEIGFGKEITIECEIISQIEIEKYVMGIGVSNSSDRRLASALIQSKQGLKAGSNLICIKLTTDNLVPGSYKLSFALAPPDLSAIKDTVEDYPAFKVVAEKENEALFEKWQSSWGDSIFQATII